MDRRHHDKQAGEEEIGWRKNQIEQA